MTKRTIAVTAAAMCVAGGTGVAIAASEGDSNRDSFVANVAKRLGVSTDDLKDATKAAAIDEVEAARKRGDITTEQANRIKERIRSGEGPGLGGPGFGGPGFHLHRGGPGGPFGAKFDAAAKYLGLSEEQLRDRLRDGKSLEDVAKERNKSVDGLEDAMLDEAKKQLDKAVADKQLTRERADAIFDRIKEHIDEFIKGDFRGPHIERFRGGPDGPGGGPPFGGGGPWGERGEGERGDDDGDTAIPVPPPDLPST
jgi:hypothetical protein